MRRNGDTVIVTAGPTRAYLDDVRFLTNTSSGALGFEICRELKRAGYQVFLVSGPTAQPYPKLKLAGLVEIETAQEMRDAVVKLIRKYKPTWAVFSAAVLDFEPVTQRTGKVSSDQSSWKLLLKPTPKIISEVGRRFPHVKRVGFKLETKKRNLQATLAYARKDLSRKGLDAVVYNRLDQVSSRQHQAIALEASGKWTRLGTKAAIAKQIVKVIKANRELR